MSKGSWYVLWLGVLFFCVSVVPCSAAAPQGKVVVISEEASSMTGGDPDTALGAGAITICNLVHEGLVRKTQEGKMAPALAKSWEVSRDGLSIKFVLDERALS